MTATDEALRFFWRGWLNFAEKEYIVDLPNRGKKRDIPGCPIPEAELQG